MVVEVVVVFGSMSPTGLGELERKRGEEEKAEGGGQRRGGG